MTLSRIRAIAASVAFIAAASFSVAAQADDLRIETRTLPVQHVTIHTSRKYADVRTALEASLNSFDGPMRQMIKENRVDDLRAAAEKGQGKYGLMIHYVAQHGDLLMLNGGKKNLITYYIGNILSATEMTAINRGAGLYAPLRVVIYEDASGGTTFEYDQPSTMFGQYRDPAIDKVAKSLDQRMLTLIRAVAA